MEEKMAVDSTRESCLGGGEIDRGSWERRR